MKKHTRKKWPLTSEGVDVSPEFDQLLASNIDLVVSAENRGRRDEANRPGEDSDDLDEQGQFWWPFWERKEALEKHIEQWENIDTKGVGDLTKQEQRLAALREQLNGMAELARHDTPECQGEFRRLMRHYHNATPERRRDWARGLVANLPNERELSTKSLANTTEAPTSSHRPKKPTRSTAKRTLVRAAVNAGCDSPAKVALWLKQQVGKTIEYVEIDDAEDGWLSAHDHVRAATVKLPLNPRGLKDLVRRVIKELQDESMSL